jgi:hypothetical protein
MVIILFRHFILEQSEQAGHVGEAFVVTEVWDASIRLEYPVRLQHVKTTWKVLGI